MLAPAVLLLSALTGAHGSQRPAAMGAFEDTGQAAAIRSSLDSMVRARAAADAFSGTVLLGHGRSVLYKAAAGLANRERRTPMRVDTRIQIASMSKLFTQIAIRQLAEAGRISLSDTVGRFLPDYPNPIVRSRVTIEQLLRHRSGVGSFFNDAFLARAASIHTVDDYLGLFSRDSLLFEPGTSEVYSNGGYVILGAIVERVSGMSYHAYLRRHVFAPAGMTSTGPSGRDVAVRGAAIGYTSQELGTPPPGDQRLAGTGPRPGYEPAVADSTPAAGAPRRRLMGPDGRPAEGARPGAPDSGRRLMLIGPDGKPMSAEQARAAMAAREAAPAGPRQPTTAFEPGLSSPAGNHYSTVDDLWRLAQALLAYRLLNAESTRALLGERYATGSDFRSNGGGPGTNAELSVFPNGYVVIVLSNYDPPAATTIAQFARRLVGASPR